MRSIGWRKRTVGCNKNERKEERERRTRDPPSQGERTSERSGRGCGAWLCSPLGGAHSSCGEPVAESEQEGSGDIKRPRYSERERNRENMSVRER